MGKVRESQRRAANVWDAKNMHTIGCKMRRELAEEFKAYAEARNTTASALIKAYVLQCLGKDQDAEPVRPEQGSREE